MAVSYGAIVVTTSPTIIVGSNNGRKGTIISNNSSQSIYIGFDSNVTTLTGTPVPSGGTFNDSGEMDAYRGAVYGVVSSGTADIRYLEWGE